VIAAPATTPAAIPPVDPKFKTVPSDVDRSAGVPKTSAFPELSFPDVQRASLSNGMQVLLAERHEAPVVQMNMEFPGGYTVDAGGKLGLANFAMEMLDDGAGEYSALELAARQEDLGAEIGVGTGLDHAAVGLSALSDKLPESLDLYADVLRRPTFDPAEIERVRATWIAGIKQEKARPQTAALRVMPPLLYGQGHPYAIPFTGSGTEASIASVTRDDLVGYHAKWLQPEKARIVVVGDTTLAELLPLLEARFGDWKTAGSAPKVPEIAAVALPSASRVFLIDQPGAIQSNVYVGQLVPSTRSDGTIDFDFANGVLGGQFSSRLNMNLRENKHWAYGSYSNASNALGQRPWFASAAVQSDKIAESIAELKSEIAAFAKGEKPATPAEIAKIRAANTLELPGAYETASAVLSQIARNQRYGRPDDYIVRYKARNQAMTPDAVQAAASLIRPQALTYVVVGDLARIEAPVRALDLGPVQVLDADGKPVAPAE
ncbi:MAG TPA: pitrilysin family protein, partial [Pseudoxanthomonas sp.]|nr:pitrilysin family protein [Pseudoxanthomonas sp.]